MLLNTSRHRCRNLRCRQQLSHLVASERQAFCCKGCRESSTCAAVWSADAPSPTES